MSRSMSRPLRVGAALVLGTAILAACGSGSASTTPASAAAQPTGAAAAPRQGGQGGFNSAEFAQIRQCLTAAGISVPTPSPRPSNSPRPSFTPGASGQTGGQFRGNGGAFGVLRSPQAQAALKACGITLPSRPPGGAARAASSTSS